MRTIAELARTGRTCIRSTGIQFGSGGLSTRRDGLALALGLRGLRSGEVARVIASDMQAPTNTLSVNTLKRRSDPETRILTTTAETVGLIQSWRDTASTQWGISPMPSALLFTSRGKPVHPSQFREFAKSYFTALGWPQGRFHALRHTFGTQLYKSTKDLALVKRELGHKSINSTMVYVHLAAEIPNEIHVLNGES